MTQPLRILLVTNKCPPDFDGGYELRAFQLAQALRARGHAVDIVTSKYRDSFTGERSDPEWVHRIFRYVDVSRARGIWRKVDRILKHLESTTVAAENVPAMETFLRTHHDAHVSQKTGSQPSTLNSQPPYDLAYCFGMLRISFAVAASIQRRDIPMLYHAGGTCVADHFFHWPEKYRGYALAMRLFTQGWYEAEHGVDFRHVAYVSNFLRDREAERGHRPAFSYVISRGIDFPLGRDVERERTQPPVFFMACRVDPTKGIHHVIAAAGILAKKRPDIAWRLEIAGESLIPPYREQVDAQIRAAGLGERIAFLGRLGRAEVLDGMRRATAFIFASIYGEPFSSTIIESMACGTPLLGSNDGSILEVVEPGVSALVHERNSPAELAANMERILDDPALARRLAEAGLATIAQRYTLDRILDLTEETFRCVIADRRAPVLSPAHA